MPTRREIKRKQKRAQKTENKAQRNARKAQKDAAKVEKIRARKSAGVSRAEGRAQAVQARIASGQTAGAQFGQAVGAAAGAITDVVGAVGATKTPDRQVEAVIGSEVDYQPKPEGDFVSKYIAPNNPFGMAGAVAALATVIGGIAYMVFGPK